MKKNTLSYACLAMMLAYSASAQKTITLQSGDLLPRLNQTHDDHYGINIAKNGSLVLIGSGLDDTDATDGICTGLNDPTPSITNVNENNGGAILYGQGNPIKYQLKSKKDQFGNAIQTALGTSVGLSNGWAAFGSAVDKVYLEAKGGSFLGKITDSIVAPKFLTSDTVVSGFGLSLALDDNNLVVGAPYSTIKGVNCGLVVVYKTANINGKNTWVREAILSPTLSDRKLSAYYGKVLALKSGKLIVGSPDYDVNNLFHKQGKVYIYNRVCGSPCSWNTVFSYSPQVDNYEFGTSVAINSTYAVVGSPKVNNAGRVDFFKVSGNTYVIDGIMAGLSGENFGGTVAIDNNSQRTVVGPGFTGVMPNDRIVLVDRNNSNFWERKAYVTAKAPNPINQTNIGASAVITSGEVAVGMGNYTYGLKRCTGASNPQSYRDYSGAAARFQFDNVLGRSARTEANDAETSVAEAQEEHLAPNPATEETVTFFSEAEIISVTANNTSGSVAKLAHKGNQINVSSLGSGLYILKIETESGTKIQKLSVK